MFIIATLKSEPLALSSMQRAGIFVIICSLYLLPNSLLLAQTIQQQPQEQEITRQLIHATDVDEIIYLQASGSWFIGLYKSSRIEQRAMNVAEGKGAVILLHGMNGHANWPTVIAPLRTQLPEFGWSTFSIQMPILALAEPISSYGSLLSVAEKRIQVAVDYLHMWDVEPIILLGYGFGAAQAMSYLADSAYSDSVAHINAVVSISMLAQKFLKPRVDIFTLISNVNIPMLDIYAEHDLQDVRWEVDDRRFAAGKNHGRIFGQMQLKHAEHDYWQSERALVEQIQHWLRQFTLMPEEDAAILEEVH